MLKVIAACGNGMGSSQMVKMIVSYREQERDIWLPDLINVIKTFRWEQ